MLSTQERLKTSPICDQSEAVNTLGEIEAAICRGMSSFTQENIGRGPSDIRVHLIGDLLVVRMRNVLTIVERNLASMVVEEKGRQLLKQVRTQLIEIARPALELMVKNIADVSVRSLHHDISTVTGEEVIVFTLENSPHFRVKKRK